MLGEENYALDIRPTFVDELDAAHLISGEWLLL